jgi:murein DD-endopeptidase MepM/ murein hydrolase activator NlpD
MIRRVPLFPFAASLLLLAGVIAIRGQWPWTRLTDVPTAAPLLVTSPFHDSHDTLQRGESVSTLLRREGITGLNLDALATAMHFDPRRIRPGLVFLVRHQGTGDSITHIEFRPNGDQRLQFIRTAAGDWRGQELAVHWNSDTVRIEADVRSSLYEALDRSIGDATFDRDERTKLSYQLADVNGYSLDFSRDLQPGDHVSSVVERQTSEFGETRFVRILASRMTVSRKRYEAYSYADGKGGYDFYDANGGALKRAFLVSPVEFRYISSGFSLARLHPILGIFRKHEGVDYAAAFGSPVRAAGDGVVTAAGYSGGYGNMIEIKHQNGVTTRYGHLSHIVVGVRPGVRVTQGELIGNVGMTGLATAPHLHYEFRVDGVARDPRSIRSDAGAPLPARALADFQQHRAALSDLLGGAPAGSPVITE